MIYAVEITIAETSATIHTLYFSSGNLVTKSTDTPASTAFDPRIIDAGSIGIHAYADGKTGGATKLEIGEIVIANIDGEYDYIRTWSADGRAVVIRYGEPGGAYPSTFTTLFRGTCEAFELYFDKLIFRLRDASYVLDNPLLTARYGGTNSLPNGIDGTADDIKGNVKPKFFGSIFNAEPVLVNTSKLIYQINNGNFNTVSAVYVRGNAVTYSGTNRANNSAMQTTAPAAGTYDTCSSEGLIRLGTSPDGLVTMDVYRGTTAANRTTAQTMSAIASNMGITAYAADVTAMDTQDSAVIGYYVNDERTAMQCLDDVGEGLNAFYYFDRSGNFRISWLQDPQGNSPVITFNEYDIISIEAQPSVDINIPVKQVAMDYYNIETVQSSDLAGAVTVARRAFLSKSSRKVTQDVGSPAAKYLLAKVLNRKSRYTTEADASSAAFNLAILFGYIQQIFEITIPIERFDLDLMECVELIHPRFGLQTGKNFMLLGYNINTQQNSVSLTLWG